MVTFNVGIASYFCQVRHTHALLYRCTSSRLKAQRWTQRDPIRRPHRLSVSHRTLWTSLPPHLKVTLTRNLLWFSWWWFSHICFCWKDWFASSVGSAVFHEICMFQFRVSISLLFWWSMFRWALDWSFCFPRIPVCANGGRRSVRSCESRWW